ncbi:MAG TPA: NUDIX domain-containing protein [Myxococcaceae bacterium]|nr:NUDIX domain-containing protein [Myxococcaceae bacterium]
MTAAEPPLPRIAARAIVLDPQARVLLVQFRPRGGEPFWATPGGALEGDETHEAAVVRELAEETGLREYQIGPCVWFREHVFTFNGIRVNQKERYFLIHTGSPALNPSFSEEQLRAEGVHGLRWWTIPELESSPERFAPTRFPSLLRVLIENGAPTAPFDCGV